jgi:dihydrofolate reductase
MAREIASLSSEVRLVRIAERGRNPTEPARLLTAELERPEEPLEPEDALQRLWPVAHELAKPPLQLALADRNLVGDALDSCAGFFQKRRGPPHDRIGRPVGVDAPRNRLRDTSVRLRRVLDGQQIAEEQGRRPRVDRLERDVHVRELVGRDTEQRRSDPQREANPDDDQLRGQRSPQWSPLRTGDYHLAVGSPDQIYPPVREDAEVALRRPPTVASPETLDNARERRWWSTFPIGPAVCGRRHSRFTLTGSHSRRDVGFVQDKGSSDAEDRRHGIEGRAEGESMGRLVVTEYISADGVVEAPSGAEPFERSGWTDGFSRGPEGNQFKVDETMASDAQLLGRITYETFSAVWPQIEGEFADKFNSMPKYVVSSTLKDPEWNNTTVLEGDVVDKIAKLKQRYERDLVVHGSPQLVQTLIEHDLVDALHLLVYPVIVGAGKRLFDGTSETKRLRLVETRTFGDGVHLMIYERGA